MASRHTFILAGGVGARLRPQTWVLPKPLMPLGDHTILERLLRDVGAAGITDVTISLGYLGHLVEAVIGDGQALGLSVDYTREPAPLGTAGALGLIARPLADDDIVLVLNGDTLTTMDFARIIDEFEAGGADAAVVCVQREVVIDFGVVHSDLEGRLTKIDEKPHLQHTVSTGINLLRGRVLRALPTGRVDMPDFVQSLARNGYDVRCVVTDALWMDLGRPEDLIAANELVEDGKV